MQFYQDNTPITPEYAEFIEEYNRFLAHCVNFQKYCKKKDIFFEQYTEAYLLYKQAKEAHIAALNSFIRLVTLYECLFKKHRHLE